MPFLASQGPHRLAQRASRSLLESLHHSSYASSKCIVPWKLVAVGLASAAAASAYEDDDGDQSKNRGDYMNTVNPFRLVSACDDGIHKLGNHDFQISAALEVREELEKVRLAQLVHDMHVLATTNQLNGGGRNKESDGAIAGNGSLRRYVTMFRPKANGDPSTADLSSVLHYGTIASDNFGLKLPQGDLTSISPAVCESLVHAVKAGGRLRLECLTKLLEASQRALLKEPTVLDLSKHETVVVVGDLHGDLNSLATILHLIGDLQQTDDDGHEKIVVFDGDFVDRGDESLEVLVILLLLKLTFPRKVFLLRGNHEDSLIASVYGFQDEVRRKYGGTNEKLWNDIAQTFATLPVAAVTASALILHGGVPSKDFNVKDLEKITATQRSQVVTMAVDLKDEQLAGIQQLLKDVLWSDPDAKGSGIKNNPRGCGVAFGPEIVGEVLERHNKRYLVRGHQPMPDGFGRLKCNVGDSPHQVLTVFSTASYSGGVVRNRGAILRLNATGGEIENGYSVTTFARDDDSSHTSEGVQTIRSLIAAKKENLAAAFSLAQNLFGFVTYEQWSTILSDELDLPGMPWQVLQPSLCPSMIMGLVFWKLFLHQHSLKNGVVKSEADAHHLAALHDNHKMLLTVFKFLDVTGSGEISLHEFKEGVDLLNRHLPVDRHLRDPDTLFRVLDKDGSGQIDFNEFEQIFEVM